VIGRFSVRGEDIQYVQYKKNITSMEMSHKTRKQRVCVSVEHTDPLLFGFEVTM